MKKNIKRIIPIVIAFIIGISTTVTAATVFNSKDITYSSSVTSKTNVKDSLDELYTKVGKCPEGQYCFGKAMPLAIVNVGDYISMTPTSTSYTIAKAMTGYTSDQTINPSKLKLWRVIKKNDDGTVEVVSHYVSGERVYFQGKTGYMNVVGVLNTIAAAYTNTKYVSKTRHIGYSNQIETCTGTLSSTTCPVDTGYESDINLLQSALGTSAVKRGDETGGYYWLPSRSSDFQAVFGVKRVNADGKVVGIIDVYNAKDVASNNSVLPILTLKANIQIISGDGKSAATAYQLS